MYLIQISTNVYATYVIDECGCKRLLGVFAVDDVIQGTMNGVKDAASN